MMLRLGTMYELFGGVEDTPLVMDVCLIPDEAQEVSAVVYLGA